MYLSPSSIGYTAISHTIVMKMLHNKVFIWLDIDLTHIDGKLLSAEAGWPGIDNCGIVIVVSDETEKLTHVRVVKAKIIES